jgi:hypothetical protein
MYHDTQAASAMYHDVHHDQCFSMYNLNVYTKNVENHDALVCTVTLYVLCLYNVSS